MRHMGGTRHRCTDFARRRMSGVFHTTTLTTTSTQVPLTGVTITRSNVNVIRSGIVGGRFTSRCVCGTCGSRGAYNILSRSSAFNAVAVTRPVNVVYNVIPAAGPASATVFGSLVDLGAHGTVVFSPRPHTGSTAGGTTSVILRTTVTTNTPGSLVN